MDPRDRLLAELLAERFLAPPAPPPPPDSGDPAVYVQRQRDLCEALDGRRLVALHDPPETAAA